MSTVTAVFVLAVACYAVASALFGIDLGRGGAKVESWATGALGAATFVHCIYLVVDYALSGRTPVATVHQTLALLSLVIAVSFLATMRRHKLPVLGAFITPMTLLLLLAAAFKGHVAEVPEPIRSAVTRRGLSAMTTRPIPRNAARIPRGCSQADGVHPSTAAIAR